MNLKKLFKRQLDLVKPTDLEFPILVIGAGGIGSWTTFALTKMGCTNITVVDFDTVETHNLPSQLYKTTQIGLYKVNALKDNLVEYTDIEITPVVGKIQDVKKDLGEFQVIIVAVDSLKERKAIWETFKDDKWDMFIDARMGGELFRVITLSPAFPEGIEKYVKNLNSKKKPHIENCSARAVVYNVFLIGGTIAATVKKFAKEENIQVDYTYDITQSVVI